MHALHSCVSDEETDEGHSEWDPRASGVHDANPNRPGHIDTEVACESNNTELSMWNVQAST